MFDLIDEIAGYVTAEFEYIGAKVEVFRQEPEDRYGYVYLFKLDGGKLCFTITRYEFERLSRKQAYEQIDQYLINLRDDYLRVCSPTSNSAS